MKRLFEENDRKLIRPDLAVRIETLLALLGAARATDDLTLPSLRLHPLKGDLKALWSVTVRANWRIVFRFKAGNAFNVDLLDYH